MGDAIVRDSGAGLILAQSQALDAAMRAAAALKNARGMIPESLRTEGEVLAVILAGQELGLPAMAALRGLQVVRGKVIIAYDTMIALLRRAGYRISWLDSTATKATLRLTAPDGEQHVETWDEARAKRAGLWGKGTWASYPETMLKARCVSSAARAFAGEVLAGVYVEGEIEVPTRVEATVINGASSGSPEVRALNDIQDAMPDDGEPDPPKMERAMHALAQCKTDGDVRTWARSFHELLDREPQTERKVERWKRIYAACRKVSPPVTRERLREWWAAARSERVQPAEAPVVERDPLAVAMDELASVETMQAVSAWASDNAATLAGIEVGSAIEREVWTAIRAKCEALGCDPQVVEEVIA